MDSERIIIKDPNSIVIYYNEIEIRNLIKNVN